MNKYVVVIEQWAGRFSAYVPDLPGCIAAADTLTGVEALIAEAIRFHIEGLREDGEPIPAPTSSAILVATP
jgi:predicted RNase H-like HicB family nuclease